MSTKLTLICNFTYVPKNHNFERPTAKIPFRSAIASSRRASPATIPKQCLPPHDTGCMCTKDVKTDLFDEIPKRNGPFDVLRRMIDRLSNSKNKTNQ